MWHRGRNRWRGVDFVGFLEVCREMDGVGLMRVSAQLKYFWNLPRIRWPLWSSSPRVLRGRGHAFQDESGPLRVSKQKYFGFYPSWLATRLDSSPKIDEQAKSGPLQLLRSAMMIIGI